MARTTQVNVGAAPNDDTGDTLRASFILVNQLITDALSLSDDALQQMAGDLGVQNVTLAADKKLALSASGTGITTIFEATNPDGTTSLKLNADALQWFLANTSSVFQIVNSAGTDGVFTVKDSGIILGDTIPPGFSTGSDDGIVIDSVGRIHSGRNTGVSQTRMVFYTPSGQAGDITVATLSTAYNTSSDPILKSIYAKALERENIYEQWGKLQKCLYGFYWLNKDGSINYDAGIQIGYNAKVACEENLQCGLGTPRASGTWDFEIGEKYGTELVDVEVQKLCEDGTPYLDEDQNEVWETKKEERDLLETPASADQGKPTSLIARMLEITREEFAEYKSQTDTKIAALTKRLDGAGIK